MKTVLKIGYSHFLLKDTAHLQTVLRALNDAVELHYDSEREHPKICWYAGERVEVGVELMAEDLIRSRKTEKAIEPEVVEEVEVIEGRVVRSRRPKRKALPAPQVNEIDARAEFERARAIVDCAGQQLLLGNGGAS